jgi:hypothetical protein
MQHNSGGAATWKRGVNRFTDFTKEELARTLGADKRALAKNQKQPEAAKMSVSLNDLPSSVDWRTRNVVSAVKDQGARPILFACPPASPERVN